MGFRFRKSIQIAKGVRLNLGSKSAGISIGGGGARIGFNTKRGAYLSGGIPGTGIYAIEYFGDKNIKTNSENATTHSSLSTNNNLISLPKDLETVTGNGCIWSFFSCVLLFSIPPLGLVSIIAQLITMYVVSKSDKNKAKTLFIDGKNFYRAKNYDEALEKFSEVLMLYPNLSEPHLIMAEIYMLKNDFDKAIFSYNKYLSENDNIEIEFKLGQAYYLNNQIQDAINIFQEFPSPYKENLSIISSLAICFMKIEKFEAALEVLLRGPTRKRKMDDDSLTFRYLLGVCYQELGDKKKALAQFNKVYSYDASFKDVEEKLNELQNKL